jgi:hypothetical protein
MRRTPQSTTKERGRVDLTQKPSLGGLLFNHRILERHALRIVLGEPGVCICESGAPILIFSAHVFLVQIGLTAGHRRLGMAKHL